MELDKRKQRILEIVVDFYLETSEPIGSAALLEYKNLGISAATVRNELRALEVEGYLTHPHTSAGRIPTEEGYQYYVEHLMKPEVLSDQLKAGVNAILASFEEDVKMKSIAKLVAEELGCAIIIALGKHNIYYTGMSQLFSQPEFKDAARTIQVSQMFDHCDVNIPKVSAQVNSSDVHVFIGAHNPLGANCGLVAAPVGQDVLVMALGPVRMPYKKLVPAIKYIQSLFL